MKQTCYKSPRKKAINSCPEKSNNSSKDKDILDNDDKAIKQTIFIRWKKTTLGREKHDY